LQIKALIVDKKPSDCIACPLVRLKLCGKPYKKRGTSGSILQGMKPDDRCPIKEVH